MKVAKFGGSSLANAERVKGVCDIVAGDKSRRIVVVSAPGKASPADTKVTDLLIACAKKHLETGSAKAELKAVVGRYAAIQSGLGLSADILQRIETDLAARLDEDTGDPARFIMARSTAAPVLACSGKARPPGGISELTSNWPVSKPWWLLTPRSIPASLFLSNLWRCVSIQ